MPTLTPTVRERIVRCGTTIYVDGLESGANLVVSVDATEFSQVVTGGGVSFTVPSLAANAVVKAKQVPAAGSHHGLQR